MHVTVPCPHCDRPLEVSDSDDGQDVKCPGCKKLMVVRLRGSGDSRTTSHPPTPALIPDCDDGTERPAATSQVMAKRFLSVPWLILVVAFGFLPWSEVSCSSKEVNLRVSQSGFQALYGGVSSPFDSLETARKVALKEQGTSKEALSEKIETERSDFLMACSPFIAGFWILAVIMLLCLFLIPLGNLRLGVCWGLVGLMVSMLVITIVVGMPLERRIDRAVQEAIKSDPDSGLMMVAAITSGKTVWFWLVLGGVLLVGATEVVTNLVWRSFELVNPLVLAAIGGGGLFLTVLGVGGQAVLWNMGLTAMEHRLALMHQAEQEKIRKAAEEEKARRERERQAEEKREADLRKEREEVAAKQKAVELEKERVRLVKERQERERQEEMERELAKQRETARLKKEAEEKARQEREAAEAKARAVRLEREEKEAGGPLEKANKLLKEDDVYKNDNAEEAERILRMIVKNWPETQAAKEAKSLLLKFEPPIRSAKERERAEDYAIAQVKYAKKLIDDGDADEARERLLKIVKEYRDTKAWPDAKKLLRKLGK